MSTKTIFKRIALVAVAALGLGVLSVVPASAAVTEETLTVSAATASTSVDETATVTVTNAFIASLTYGATSGSDSRIISAVVSGPGTASTKFRATTDSSNSGTYYLGSQDAASVTGSVGVGLDRGVGAAGADSASVVANTGSAYTKGSFELRLIGFTAAGTYTVTVTSKDFTGTIYKSAIVTVTVTASTTTTATGGNVWLSADAATAANARINTYAYSESTIVVTAGTPASPTAVGYAFAAVTNSAGETRTAGITGIKNSSTGTAVIDTVTVTVTGPGLVSGISSTKAKTATVQSQNGNNRSVQDTLTIFSDGTAGTMTLKWTTSLGVLFKTQTVTFTGDPASAAIALSDTIVSGTAGTTVVGTVRDSGGNIMKSGTVYIFSSDTATAGTNLSTNVDPIRATAYTIPSTGVLAYALTTGNNGKQGRDTGLATITLRDSWTVAASTWSSNEIVVDVRGSKIVTLTVAFDKATYSPGERAVITYTAKDSAGKVVANAELTGLTPVSNATLTDVTTASITGTNGGAGNFTVLGTSFKGLQDTGVETRVVTMPTFGTKVTLTNSFATFGSTSGEKTTVTAEATVVDPNATAIAASQAAADAATDAAAEAIDAANAATDAANLAAEAADAATVAAEEARDAADAATAAVEELATQVATLMAALKAQITTLANTVAKIAKKVKA